MVRQGCTVILACRSLNKGETAINDIIGELNDYSKSIEDNKELVTSQNINLYRLKERLILIKLDLSSLQSVYDFCIAFKGI